MRILVIGEANPHGGTGTFLFRLLDFLAPGNEVSVALKAVFTPALQERLAGYPITVRPYERLRKNHGRLYNKIDYELAVRGLKEPLSYRADRKKIKRLIKRLRPELIIVSNTGGTNFFPVFCQNLPVLFFVHSIISECPEYTKRKVCASRFMGNKRIVHVSAFARNEFNKAVRFEDAGPQTVTVLPNYAAPPVQAARKKTDGFITVLTLGVLHGFKNPDLWLEVAVTLTTEFPKLRFVWAGTSEHLGHYRELAKAHDRIDFIGFTDDTATLYQQADIYFQPSEMESQGIAVIEAMSYHLPCVVSAAGGLTESVTDGENGFSVPAGNAPCFAQKLRALITDRALREKMGNAGYESYQKKFSEEKWKESLKTLMAKVTAVQEEQ